MAGFIDHTDSVTEMQFEIKDLVDAHGVALM